MNGNDLERVAFGLGCAPQEAKVAALAIQGKQNKQIAKEMNLKMGAVKTYLARISQRTGTSGRVELAAHIFAHAVALREQEKERQ